MAGENAQELTEGVETPIISNGASVDSDGTIKLNLGQINRPAEEEPLVSDQVSDQVGDQVDNQITRETPVLETIIQEEEIHNVIEEITDEPVQEYVQELQNNIQEAITESKEAGVQLPDNIQKVVNFINETGGSLEDYVKLNTDYSKLDNYQLLKEYYQNTKPHLDSDEIDFLMEDNFAFDEEEDDERDVRKKKIAQKEELQKAKQHLDGLKSKYYTEIKAGSKLAPEQQKAVEFFNRYNEENEEATKLAEKQTQTFLQKTDQVFSDDFKGFDYQVGEKKYRFNVKNAPELKNKQSDINNFIKKFLNEKNEMSDAAGYHKGLFTAMNADSVAQHFYEQGKSDAMRDSTSKAKNIEMGVRGVHQDVKSANGWQVRSVDAGVGESKLKIKTFRNI